MIKILTGKVISCLMNKTLVIITNKIYKHYKYKKYLKKNKKYHVHDEYNLANIGDYIEFFLCKSISKTKYSVLLKILINDTSRE